MVEVAPLIIAGFRSNSLSLTTVSPNRVQQLVGVRPHCGFVGQRARVPVANERRFQIRHDDVPELRRDVLFEQVGVVRNRLRLKVALFDPSLSVLFQRFAVYLNRQADAFGGGEPLQLWTVPANRRERRNRVLDRTAFLCQPFFGVDLEFERRRREVPNVVGADV
ncbi:hypothetical protein [Mycolicibacterium conceptionense]|uniref:hypothetical protein n=1 Tax=Mycolicibacterium conceptionense TaxID=451644 RepID=UPI003D16209E